MRTGSLPGQQWTNVAASIILFGDLSIECLRHAVIGIVDVFGCIVFMVFLSMKLFMHCWRFPLLVVQKENVKVFLSSRLQRDQVPTALTLSRTFKVTTRCGRQTQSMALQYWLGWHWHSLALTPLLLCLIEHTNMFCSTFPHPSAAVANEGKSVYPSK